MVQTEPHSTAATLDVAAQLCLRQGGQLTSLRRSVLALVIDAGRPLTAYQLLDRLRHQRRNAVPPTIYRALDFLLEHGLIHRSERLNAFIPSSRPGEQRRPVQFLICTACGTVATMENDSFADLLERAAASRGFCSSHATVEVEGTCAICAQAEHSPATHPP